MPEIIMGYKYLRDVMAEKKAQKKKKKQRNRYLSELKLKVMRVEYPRIYEVVEKLKGGRVKAKTERELLAKYCEQSGDEYHSVNKRHAEAILKHYEKTGELDYGVAMAPVKKDLPDREGIPYKDYSDIFYKSRAWQELRYQALLLNGRKCQCCGRTPPDVRLHVDHIKPRFKYPEYELEISNLQILCEDCNLGKGAWDETDHRGDR